MIQNLDFLKKIKHFLGRRFRLQKCFLLSLLGKRHILVVRHRQLLAHVDQDPARHDAESERSEEQVHRQAGDDRHCRKPRHLEIDSRFN